jgi:hypothetical protein
MTRKSLTVYNYREVPEKLPPSKHQTGFIDALDIAIEGFWNEEIRKFMQPIGHPQSKRFFIQQYQAVQIIQAEAALKGMDLVAKADVWKLMSALRRVANRRGIAPRQLLASTRVAAE